MTTNPPTYTDPSRSSGYTPREGTLADRALAFFRQHPDEELSQADVALKFDAQRSSVKTCLAPSVSAGLINWGLNAENSWVYTAGAALRKGPAPGPFDALSRGADLGKAEAAVSARPTPQRGRAVLPPALLDFTSLKVERGVPLTGRSQGVAGMSKWAQLFAMLNEPDTSVEIPESWKIAVAAQATKLNAANKKAGTPTEYKVRMTEPGKVRIWRLA